MSRIWSAANWGCNPRDEAPGGGRGGAWAWAPARRSRGAPPVGTCADAGFLPGLCSSRSPMASSVGLPSTTLRVVPLPTSGREHRLRRPCKQAAPLEEACLPPRECSHLEEIGVLFEQVFPRAFGIDVE